MTNFEIKNRFTGAVIWSGDAASIADAVNKASALKVSLSSADLSYADLRSADLRSANLRSAKNSALAIAMTRILPEGDLIGWKKCSGGVLAKLKIPANAKRSHAFGRKCRAEFVVVGAEQGVTNFYGPETIYRAGETVRPNKWDDDFTNECSNGIHFYITREEAEAHS